MMLKIGYEVAVAGEAFEHLRCRGCLHLHGGFERLFTVKITDAHLPGAHNQRNFVFSDHYRHVVKTGRPFCKPAVGVVQRELRMHPAARPLGCDEIPELVEVPEGVPEGIAAYHHIRIRIRYLASLSVGRNPFTVHVAPYVAAAEGAVHVVVKLALFNPVVRFNADTCEEVVPCVGLIAAYGVEIPAEWFDDFGEQILGGVGYADGRNGCAHFYHGIAGGAECRENSGKIAFAGFEFADIVLYFIVEPAAHAQHRTVELNYKVDCIVLVGIVAPYAGRYLMRITLDACGAYFLDFYVLEVKAVLGLRLEVDENASVAAVGRECELLHAAARSGGDFGFDAVVGEFGRVISDVGALGALVDARAVAFVGTLFVAYTREQRSVRRHNAEAGEGPLMYMAEAAYILKCRLVSGLPPAVLIVGT